MCIFLATFSYISIIINRKGVGILAKDIYKRLTVIFYEKDKECYEEFNQLAQDQDISMTNLAKKLIYKELEDSKKG
nr:MAG TPA: Transcriptional regulator, RHH-like, CopG [Caudoviricetes sp.]